VDPINLATPNHFLRQNLIQVAAVIQIIDLFNRESPLHHSLQSASFSNLTLPQ